MEEELFVDNFAGGGGASTGIEMAIGRSVDIAINHDPDAIAMHKANHPKSTHYCEDVWQVNPVEACAGRSVALAWFSPDCKHFSRAKGGKPVDKNIRGLAWVAVRWAYMVKPRCIMLENVPEIQTWGPLEADNKPIKARAGETFEGFVLALSTGIPRNHPAFGEMCAALEIDIRSEMADALTHGLGYHIEHRILKSCDYGAPTTRTRFYLIARCDGQPIIWPATTHAPKDSDAVRSGKKKPYHTAAECIDWSIPAQSIFDRKKPLAENTLRRIARGIQKFVIDNPEPFIVTVNHSGDGFRGQEINAPLQTVTAKHGYGIVAPTLIQYHSETAKDEVRGQSVDEPLMTQDTS
ncbi:MAG: DNA cytosine methyltransferase, partial [Clostridia bacterium]|nr:DNA cytosine methyltransferase [Clostridia bacterium]